MSEKLETLQTQAQYAGGAYSNMSVETVFHAVYIPQDSDKPLSENNGKETMRVYQDKAEALKVIKAFKTGRLKTFKSQVEAEEYATTGYEKNSTICQIPASPTVNVAEEKSNNFKAPRSQDLVLFRKLIESGDLVAVRSTVWGNPRYLISSGDTPAILQEGCRYNALHVAVRAGKTEMCDMILNTVGNADFIKLLYGEEECKNYLDRAEIMLDLYLNTPDKGLNETPLHFAVKFGLRDIVRILVSYPQCEKKLRNKFDQSPLDVICARKCQNEEGLKREIRMLLEEQYYVPVLRSEDGTIQPVIGDPFSPTSPMSFKADPISPRVEVRAFAGPMTKSRALEFKRKWKTPPRLHSSPLKKFNNPDTNHLDPGINNIALRLQDPEKGLERIGRDLAEEYEVSWKEYWPFLNDFADFRCAEGLTRLDKYLEKQFTNRIVSYNMDHLATSTNLNKNDPNDDDIDFICKQLESYTITDTKENLKQLENNLDDLEFFTPPSSPKLGYDSSDDDMEVAEEGSVTFLEGSSAPTKVDDAVFNALPTIIDLNTYPNVYRWRHEMQLAMNRDPSRSTGTRSIRRKLVVDY